MKYGVLPSSSVVGINGTKDGQCSKAHLGYTIDSTVANALYVKRVI